jgi:sugar lactone lactonase YvrE
VLYWCDIPGRSLNRYTPESGEYRTWLFEQEPGSAAPVLGGGLLLALRDGLWFFNPADGQRRLLAAAPYDAAVQRFNDGKADPQGRFWVGTLHEPREPALAALYRFADGRLQRMAGDITTSNGLAWSPDAATLYWSDTKAHLIRAFDFNAAEGTISAGREFARFPAKSANQAHSQDLSTYGGRPDGAAVDIEGAYWVAMYEGQRLLRLAASGELLQAFDLPVRCATMPCFGDADWRTLYLTTACDKRPPDELTQQPLAGRVLRMRVAVPGLPTNFVKL